MAPSHSTRRAYLSRAGAALAAAGLAGCSGRGGSATDSRTGTATSEDDSSSATAASTAATDTTTATATTGTPIHPGYDTTEVRVETPDGERLGAVTAAIADTAGLRYTGLSDTESLPDDRGMLFVYDEVQDLTFVMRRMSFGIDIVYADGDGTITRIHHAPAPGPGEDGNEQEYPGRGQYVLEVNLDWTTKRGVEEGDVLQFSL